ncbi:PEP-CTERM sorting domain-containing protein [Aestuariibacter halophilus]|uniref:PEP-CTERM sorting domain-containing protein n=1 Tax=Fluctibacter halophilus TaxID=226011 RepID=A0ABS8G485_9ALTE|nr:PEP-CTERM sorting domain-containing protein [Aestuariibacter halophilus]MCC2615407.1 PEP-CTERM sorting domain-containing protein [Aestuariibacter halophilus]
MKFSTKLFLSGLLALSASTASASLITTADFNEQLSLPTLVGPDVREFEVLGAAVGAGNELTDANEIANPGGYSGHANMDLDQSGLLTLTGQEPAGFADYQLAVFTLTNILFDTSTVIAGVTVIGQGNEIFDGQNQTLFPIPSVSFTDNSVTITYHVGQQSISDEFNFGQDLQAQFQLVMRDVQGQVPEPAYLGLTGLVLLMLSMRRKHH